MRCAITDMSKMRDKMVSRTVMIGIVAAIVVIIAGAGIYALMQPPVTPPTTKHKMAVLLPGPITEA